MVLDNLEQMHPRYLVDLLANGDLEKVINQRVIHYLETLARSLQRNPKADLEYLQELGQSEILRDDQSELAG